MGPRAERGRRIGSGERTFIDSIIDVKRRRWVGTRWRAGEVTEGGMSGREVEGVQRNWVNDLRY